MKKFVVEGLQLTQQNKDALKKLSEDYIMNFIADNFDVSYYDINYIVDIAWVMDVQLFYIKFNIETTSNILTKFVEAKFDGNHLAPTDDIEVMSARKGLQKFKQKHPTSNSKDFILCWS